MPELASSLRSLLRPRLVQIAVAIAAVVSAVIFIWHESLPYAVVISLSAFSAFWVGLAIATTARFHVFRQGSAIVPGYRDQVLRGVLVLGLALTVLPIATAALRGSEVFTIAAFSLLGLATAMVTGPLFPDNQRVSLGLLSFALAADTVLFFEYSRGRTSFWWSGLDPVWQKTGVALLAVIGLGWSLWFQRRLREDAWVATRWWARGQADCMECGGQSGMPDWALALVPAFGRRRLPRRDNGRTVESKLRQSLLRYSLHPLSPLGLALFYLPFVILITWLAAREDDVANLFWNPNLLLLNGLIILFGSVSPSRLRREWMRPASRQELVTGILRGLRRDVALFTVCFLPMVLLVHLIAAPQAMHGPAYWLGFAMAPFLMVMGHGLALWASRWTRWSGLVGFLPAWLLAAVAFAAAREDPRLLSWSIALGASVVAAAIGAVLSRVGTQHWRRVELG